MSSASLVPLPCCAQCWTVKAEGIWFKKNGAVASTTQKLSVCAQCHIARYCSIKCQRNHWDIHQIVCVDQRSIAPRQVDAFVASIDFILSPKEMTLRLSKNHVLSIEQWSKESSQDGKLSVDVRINQKIFRSYSYVLCTFDWRTKLKIILNPLSVNNPWDQAPTLYEEVSEQFIKLKGKLIDLARAMIRQGLCLESFRMMTEIPQSHRDSLNAMFFPVAVSQMRAQQVNVELIVKCAELLNKNREDVEAIIQPNPFVELPDELQAKIAAAEKQPYGERDVEMAELAQEVVKLGFYDKAFSLIRQWVVLECAKGMFFIFATKVMIAKKIPYDKLLQLGRSIGLSSDQILNEILGIYALSDREFACKLALQETPVKAVYFLEIIFDALQNEGRKIEVETVLDLVSEYKKRDQQLALKK